MLLPLRVLEIENPPSLRSQQHEESEKQNPIRKDNEKATLPGP
jgi:hypothetical protein